MQTSFARGPSGTYSKAFLESDMAIYHLSVKTISRAAGRSATAAAAYRSGCVISDFRTGEIFDYRRKRGVVSAYLVLPSNAPEWASDRAALWNAAETAETRKNSTVAREFEIALPEELSADERKRLALNFAREIVARHGCAADVAIHSPAKNGDHRNHHAHILCSTRRLTSQGFGEKTRELDERKSLEIVRWRKRFAEIQNAFLRESGSAYAVDHRSLEARGIRRQPTAHNGAVVTAILRRGGRSFVEQARANARLEEAAFRSALKHQSIEIANQIIILSTDIQSAIAMRNQLPATSLNAVDHSDSFTFDEMNDNPDDSEQIYRP